MLPSTVAKRRTSFRSASNLTVTTVPTTVPCPHCHGTMGLVRHLELKDMPEIYIFYCSRCQHAETVKQERAA
jgi:transcription elongation factor Elf1